ncbi:MAG: hypothetical protein Q7V57_13775 [Actinomycetota bacterium]|nr:hypothetical protein [Actinomycetota bacterium]
MTVPSTPITSMPEMGGARADGITTRVAHPQLEVDDVQRPTDIRVTDPDVVR